jgi:hypothetical protein
VLKLCLGEILKCQYFVSMLGNRYGWCQDGDAEADEKLTRTLAVAKDEFPQFANIIDRWVPTRRIRSIALACPTDLSWVAPCLGMECAEREARGAAMTTGALRSSRSGLRR